MNDRIPVTIVTGFLGAGKTTLLSNLIKDSDDLRLAIVVNEFGEVSIDDSILKRHGQSAHLELHDIPNGLVGYGGDARFCETLLSLKERRSLIDHVLVETSGLAVPTAVIEVLQSQEFSEHFVLDATLDVIDTPHFRSPGFWERGLDNSIEGPASLREVFQRQLECADVVVLNKIDYLEEDILLAVENDLRHMSPSLRFIEMAYHGKLDRNLALGLRLNQSTAQLSNFRMARSPLVHAHRDGHDHSGMGPHEHGVLTHQHVHDHDPGWVSFALHSHDTQDGTLLQSALLHIANTEPVMRVKGTVFLPAVKEPVIVQGVRTRIEIHEGDLVATGKKLRTTGHSSARSTDTSQNYEHDSQLVFIGYHLDRGNVAAKLQEFTSTDWH